MAGANPDEHARFRLADSVRAVELEGELVLLDLARGDYFGLGDVGTRAWSGLSTGRSIAETASDIAAGYDASAAEIARDLLDFARELTAAGLLVPVASTAGAANGPTGAP